MLTFHDPVTAIFQGFADRAAAQAEAADLKAQATLERTATQQELRDEREENKRQLARTRALLSGGGVDVGAILSLTSAQTRESLIRQHRIESFGATRAGLLTGRARNVQKQGDIAAAIGVTKGITSGFKNYNAAQGGG